MGRISLPLAALNQQDFGSLIEQHRSEIQAHCYRMSGTLQDAEDMVQETFLRAWKRRETYTEDVLLRAWLYKIATNVCLDALKKQRRRAIPKTLGEAANAAEPIPSAITEPIWLEPYPDELLAWGDANPETEILKQESISIAFMAALQRLPPRQRAVLILSDVLEWSAGEIAALLETTVSAVKSALHRARAALGAAPDAALPPDETTKTQLAAYMLAWQAADVDALTRLLRDDATFSMPPIPSWYQGRESIRALVARTIFAGQADGCWRLHPTRANGQIAFGLYRLSETGSHEAYGVQVLTFRGGLIADIITFRVPHLLARFGLPASL